ncbi:MAG: hypothetical protein ACYDHG_13455, partial [Desulfomonilaceae bacterium]
IEALLSNMALKPDLTKLTTDESKWKQAIALAVDYTILSANKPHTALGLSEIFYRQHSVAKSASYFRQKGHNLAVIEGRIECDKEIEIQIAAEIVQAIRKIGGVNVCHRLIDVTQGHPHLYSATEYLGRLAAPMRNRDYLVPVGYLINLAVKHLSETPTISVSREQALLDLFELSKHFTALYDLQPYDPFANFFVPKYSQIDSLVEYCLFDRLFKMSNQRPSDTARILRGLFSWIDDQNIKSKVGWDSNDAASFAQICLALCPLSGGPYVIQEQSFYKHLSSLKPSVVFELLRVFSHDCGAVNAGYSLPTDLSLQETDLSFRPLIKLNSHEYCLLNQGISSLSFYEALAAYLRIALSQTEDVDHHVAKNLEIFVKRCLAEKGFKVLYGKFKIQKIEGDIDAAIETDSHIVLIECKKKALTREARAGDSDVILHDLALGLIHGQTQLAKVASLLHNSTIEKLHQTASNKISDLTLGNKRLLRIFLCLTDYGALHHASYLETLLEFFYSTGFKYRNNGSNTSEYHNDEEKFEKFRKTQKDLLEKHPGPQGRQFYDCFFLNLNQFIYLLDQCPDADSFVKQLLQFKTASFGSRDVYQENVTLRYIDKKR